MMQIDVVKWIKKKEATQGEESMDLQVRKNRRDRSESRRAQTIMRDVVATLTRSAAGKGTYSSHFASVMDKYVRMTLKSTTTKTRSQSREGRNAKHQDATPQRTKDLASLAILQRLLKYGTPTLSRQTGPWYQ